MGKQMRWQVVIGLSALLLVGCSTQVVVPPIERGAAQIVSVEEDEALGMAQDAVIDAARRWFEAHLAPMTWEEYRYGQPEQMGTPVIQAKIRDEGRDHYEVSVVTTRVAMPCSEASPAWEMLYPHDQTRSDRVRLEETYWLTYSHQSQGIAPLATQSVRYKRLPYDEAAVMPEALQRAFQTLIGQPKTFFETYAQLQEAARPGYLREQGVDTSGFYLPTEQLAMRYPDGISPYGLGEQIQIDWDGQSVQISDYATQKQGRYQISVPVSLLLNHYKKVYYRYNYFVGTEDGKIEWIRLERVVQDAP